MQLHNSITKNRILYCSLFLAGIVIVFGSIFSLSSYKKPTYPFMVSEMRKKQYPGSNIKIESKLILNNSAEKYLASYYSDGLKIFGILAIPIDEKPQDGWPSILLLHGYVTPENYNNTLEHQREIDFFAKNGYIVFMPDYRGFGNSQGVPSDAFAYTVDALNAFSSLKKHTGVNSKQIGMWGHSLGGNIILRSLVISNEVKAAVIWAGAVGTLDEQSKRKVSYWNRSPREQSVKNVLTFEEITNKYGEQNFNNDLWKSFDPRAYTQDITTPIQLHQGLRDDIVPSEYSFSFKNDLEHAKKTAELYIYQNEGHFFPENIFTLAMDRSLKFFNTYLKDKLTPAEDEIHRLHI